MNEELKRVRIALANGDIAVVDGMRVRWVPGHTCLVPHDIYPDDACEGSPDYLKKGDWYVAGRNTGPHLLCVDRVNYEGGYVIADSTAYAFDTGECMKVEVLWEES